MGIVDGNDADWGQLGAGSLRLGIPIKLLVLAGFVLARRHCFGAIPRWPASALILSLLFGMFASLFAADYQFGFQCCQRHEAVRQCFMIMVLLACACLITPMSRHRPRHPTASVLCLMLAIAPMAAWRLPDIVQAYRSTRASEISLHDTWQSGLAPATSAVIAQQPATALTHAWTLPPGKHRSSPDDPYDITSIIRFFGKREITVLAPSGRPGLV